MPAMGDSNEAPAPSDESSLASQAFSASSAAATCREDAMICERCGKAELYRMQAVWRCPACGFKTDCCGW